MRSSAMSPSGEVSKRLVKPVPGPVVKVATMLAPKSRSVALVVVADPLVVVLLLPVFAAIKLAGYSQPASTAMTNSKRRAGLRCAKRPSRRSLFIHGLLDHNSFETDFC